MKKENFDLALWSLNIGNAIKRAKHSGVVPTQEGSEKRQFVEKICKIANDAITQIEAEIEKLD